MNHNFGLYKLPAQQRIGGRTRRCVGGGRCLEGLRDIQRKQCRVNWFVVLLLRSLNSCEGDDGEVVIVTSKKGFLNRSAVFNQMHFPNTYYSIRRNFIEQGLFGNKG